MMSDYGVSFTSLCYVFKNEYNGQVWLSRIADIKDGKLHLPFKSGRQDNYFENRDRIYRHDGPSEEGTFGIWEWSENPATNRVQSRYISALNPVRVIIQKGINSLDELLEELKAGNLYSSGFICDTLFCYEEEGGRLAGLFCQADEYENKGSRAKLKEKVYCLPYYQLTEKDIFSAEDKRLRFIKELKLNESSDFVEVGDATSLIREIVLNRFSWSLFKETIGTTKAEWRNSKILFQKICETTLYEEATNKLNCPPDMAKNAVEKFINRAGNLLEEGDIDQDTLAKIVLNHEGLLAVCTQGAEARWRAEHEAELEKARIEVANVFEAAEKKREDEEIKLREAKDESLKLASRKAELEEDIEMAECRLTKVLSDIEVYESLGDETIVKVKEKIAEAQKDMAAFIADLSVVLPKCETKNAEKINQKAAIMMYSPAVENLFDEEEIEQNENWEDEWQLLYSNLYSIFKMESDRCKMLTSYLYAAAATDTHLLIAGPAGGDIANILSLTMYGKEAGKLTLGNEFHYDIAQDAAKYKEEIFSIHNMFGKGWSDIYPQDFSRLRKMIVWTHPYAEDLGLEPKGLYNYMLPLFSECFINEISVPLPLPGKREEKFKKYSVAGAKKLSFKGFQRLGLSSLTMNRLQNILTNAKAILNDPAKDKDMEVLFGLLPLCILTGRMDILSEEVSSENGISQAVKNEVKRYIGEEV